MLRDVTPETIALADDLATADAVAGPPRSQAPGAASVDPPEDPPPEPSVEASAGTR